MNRQLRIMVLDRSKTSRKILEVILQRAGHLVVSSDDPAEALQFLFRRGSADMLFLDTELPRADGFDVLKRLKGKQNFRSTVPIALLREGFSVLDRIKVRQAGAQHAVAKPLVQQRIIALVSSHHFLKDGIPEEGRSTEVARQWGVGRWDAPKGAER